MMQGENAARCWKSKFRRRGWRSGNRPMCSPCPTPTLPSALAIHSRTGLRRASRCRNVLDHLSVSRSWLERNFRKLLNRSPQAEIRNVQLKRCKELLRTTTLSLEKIARLTGFEHPEYMNVVFKREIGETPGRYRNYSNMELGTAVKS